MKKTILTGCIGLICGLLLSLPFVCKTRLVHIPSGPADTVRINIPVPVSKFIEIHKADSADRLVLLHDTVFVAVPEELFKLATTDTASFQDSLLINGKWYVLERSLEFSKYQLFDWTNKILLYDSASFTLQSPSIEIPSDSLGLSFERILRYDFAGGIGTGLGIPLLLEFDASVFFFDKHEINFRPVLYFRDGWKTSINGLYKYHF